MDVAMRLPDLSTNASAVTVIRWLVEVGRPVRRGEPLVEVETDKAVMEVESVVTGTLRSVVVPAGGQVDVGEVIAHFEVADAGTARVGEGLSPAPPVSVAVPTNSRTEPRPATGSTMTTGRVSFFARNRASRAGGHRGATPAALPLSVPHRTLVRRMRESTQTVPHFALQTSANAEPMVSLRASAAESGRKIAWDAFFVVAVGKALERFGRMGYRYEDDRLVPQGDGGVAVAVDLDDELFTVVVGRPAGKPLDEVSDEIRAGVARLRSGDPRARVLQPAALTVSNLGGSNVESFVAIINPPESAILAVGKVLQTAVVVDGRITVQSRVTLTLSVDHRVVNGKYAAGFLGAIVEAVESF